MKRGKNALVFLLAAVLLAGGITGPVSAASNSAGMIDEDLDDEDFIEDEYMVPEEIAEELADSYEMILEEASMDDPDDTEFALVDMNQDGIKELIISAPGTGSGRLFSFYTSDADGNAVLAGEYDQYADLYAANDGEGVYTVLDKKGKRYVDLITIWGEDDEWELFDEEISVSNRVGREFKSGHLITLENADLFLRSGRVLSVLTEEEYVFADSDKRFLTVEELVNLDEKTLRLARNEIYARRGRRFQTRDLKEYFESKSWYNGYLSADEFDESVFNKYENANIRLISNVEKGNY